MGFNDLKEWVYSRRITLVRRGVATGFFVFLFSMLFGVQSFGRDPFLRYILLPNASCRYIDNAPTYCYYYSLQQWLQGGYTTMYVDLMIPMLIVLLLIVGLGRWWCSWACPFGLIQEILMGIRKFFRIPHLQLSYRWVTIIDQLKYGMLFFTLLIAISIGIPRMGLQGYSQTLALPFCQICPAKPVFLIIQVIPGLIPKPTFNILTFGMLFVFLIGSFFIRMFWCRLCPMGALMALVNRTSLVWLKKEPSKCTKCRICLRVCPQDFHDVYEEMEKKNINGGECTLCGRCVESCPEPGALSITVLNKEVVTSKPRR